MLLDNVKTYTIPGQMMVDDNLNIWDLRVYAYIQDITNAGQEVCKDTTKDIAESLSISTRTIERCLKRLDEGNYLVRERSSTENVRYIYA